MIFQAPHEHSEAELEAEGRARRTYRRTRSRLLSPADRVVIGLTMASFLLLVVAQIFGS